MKWIIEYVNGKVITEDEMNFQFVNKNNVRFFYFIDNRENKYGFNFTNKIFFINNKLFDFKINNGDFEIIQFKTASISWNIEENQKIKSWNIGFQSLKESYIMSITNNEEVYLIAEKHNNKSNQAKTIRLQ